MAKSVVGLEVNVSGNAEKSILAIKTELKNANKEIETAAAEFGVYSQQVKDAEQKVAVLKNQLAQATEQSRRLSSVDRLAAFNSALNTVAGGISTVIGAQALLGTSSEDVEKQLAKVQGALALSQGIQSITEAASGFKKLGVAAVTTFNAIRTAIGSSGIGLLAIAIGAIVMAMKDWYDSTQKQVSAEELLKQKEEALRDEIKKTNDEIENRNKINNYLSQVEILNAKARGASVQELRKIEDKFYYEQAYNRQVAKDDAIKAFDEAEKNYTKDSQIYKDALDQKNKKLEEWYESNRQRELELGRRRVEDYNTDVQKNKERGDQIISDNKRIADANAAQNDLQKKLQDEIDLANIKDERKRAEKKLKIDLENAKTEVDRSDAIVKEKNESKALLEKQYEVNLRAMKDKWAEEDKQKQLQKQKETDDAITDARLAAITDENFKRQAQIDINRQAEIDKQAEAYNNGLISLEQYNQAVNGINFKYDKELTDFQKTLSDQRIKQAEVEAQLKIQLAQSVGSALGELSNLVGAQTALGKGLALAQIAIDTGLAISALTKNSEANPANAVTAGIAGAIQFATGLARIIANIAKAKQILSQANVPARGGGGGGTPTGTTAPLSPQLQVQNTQLNQGQINQLASATTRAFVLESDVSGNQERIRRINRAARIN